MKYLKIKFQIFLFVTLALGLLASEQIKRLEFFIGTVGLRPAVAQEAKTEAKSGSDKIEIEGYQLTCIGKVMTLYRRVNDSWEKIDSSIPVQGLYYLEDEFVGYGLCDGVTCVKISQAIDMSSLLEYKKVGERQPPSDSGMIEGVLAPVYKSFPLKGEIKIDFKYFTDKECKTEKSFSRIVNY